MIYLSICLQYIYLSVYDISIYLSMIYLSIRLFVYLHIYSSNYNSPLYKTQTDTNHYKYLSVYLSIYLAIFLYNYLSILLKKTDTYLYITILCYLWLQGWIILLLVSHLTIHKCSKEKQYFRELELIFLELWLKA